MSSIFTRPVEINQIGIKCCAGHFFKFKKPIISWTDAKGVTKSKKTKKRTSELVVNL